MVGALGCALGTAADGAAPAVVVLSQSGQPIERLCESLASTPLPAGVVVVLGDDRGMSEEDEAAIQATVRAIASSHGSLRHTRNRNPLTRWERGCTQAAARGSQLHRVCLGGDALFASHCIVLVQVRICTPNGSRMHHPPQLVRHWRSPRMHGNGWHTALSGQAGAPLYAAPGARILGAGWRQRRGGVAAAVGGSSSKRHCRTRRVATGTRCAVHLGTLPVAPSRRSIDQNDLFQIQVGRRRAFAEMNSCARRYPVHIASRSREL
jgi:hypothetical protein